MDNQSSVQQIRLEHGILVTSVRLDQAATSPTFLHGVKSDEDIRRSLASCTVPKFQHLLHTNSHCAYPEQAEYIPQLHTVLQYVMFHYYRSVCAQ